MSTTPTPAPVAHHYLDRLFRQQLAIPDHAAALVALVDPVLAASLDWNSMEVEPPSQIDAALRERIADLVLLVPSRGSGDAPRHRIYLIFEQQSTPLAILPLRVGEIPEEIRTLIATCDDPATLSGWSDRVLGATTVEGVIRDR